MNLRASTLLLPTTVLLVLSGDLRADLITGQVVDSLGIGVPGVDIDVKNLGGGGDPPIFNDGTDANGFFSTTLPAGDYRVTFTPLPPPTTTHLVLEVEDVNVAGTTPMGVIPLPAGVALSGHIENTSGTAVAGVNVDVIDRTTGENLILPGDLSNVSGDFSVAVPAGPIELRLDATPVLGQTLASRRFSLEPSANTFLGDIVLEPGFLVTALVLGPGALGVIDLDFDVSDASGSELYTPGDETDNVGFADFVVPAGSFSFQLCPQFVDQLVSQITAPTTISANTNLGLFNMQAGSVLSGKVTNLAVGVPGVDIDVEDALSGLPIPLCNDDTDGFGDYAVVVPAGLFDLEFDPSFSQPLGPGSVNGVAIAGPTTVNTSLPACPFFTTVAPGTSGSGGFVPQLGATGGAPRLGNDGYGLSLSGGLGGASGFVVLQRGIVNVRQTFPVGASLTRTTWDLPIAFTLSGPAGVPGAGSWSTSLPIGVQTALLGNGLTARAFVFDSGVVRGVAASNKIAASYCD